MLKETDIIGMGWCPCGPEEEFYLSWGSFGDQISTLKSHMASLTYIRGTGKHDFPNEGRFGIHNDNPTSSTVKTSRSRENPRLNSPTEVKRR
jgi:hypothetical protein